MNEEELKKLLERYYDGCNTSDEEKVLRAFFSKDDIPPGYEAEKEIFSFHMSSVEVPEPSSDFEERILKAVDASVKRRGSSGIRKILIPLFSAAAGLLILTGIYFFFINKREPADTYSDPQIAYAETVKILLDVSSQMNQGARSLQPVGRINEIKAKSFKSINKSTALVEKNLRSLGYLKNSDELENDSTE